MPPSRCSIDYEAVLSEARAHGTANTALLLQERLPSIWSDVYLRARAHTSRISFGFTMTRSNTSWAFTRDWKWRAAAPYDQTIADRVIGVLGKPSRAQQGT